MATVVGGYDILTGDGGVHPFGSASAFGSLQGKGLNAPPFQLVTTPDGRGYWIVASDGGVFSFGDARFHGSTGNLVLNKPVVAMAPTPDGGGYWLIASDGGVFSFGDARFHGSTGNLVLNKPVVAMAPTPDGGGYWLIASDGGIFSFGDARFHGSLPGIDVSGDAVALAAPSGGGYLLATAAGYVYGFGTTAAGRTRRPRGDGADGRPRPGPLSAGGRRRMNSRVEPLVERGPPRAPRPSPPTHDSDVSSRSPTGSCGGPWGTTSTAAPTSVWAATRPAGRGSPGMSGTTGGRPTPTSPPICSGATCRRRPCSTSAAPPASSWRRSARSA